MRKLRILFFITEVLALLTITAACADSSGQYNIEGPTQTVTDSAGREVVIPEKVSKIAALYLPAGDISIMLGHGSEIVAISNGLKRDVLTREICPEIENASVVKLGDDLNVEEMVALGVDIAFISNDMSTDKKTTSALDKFHIPYVIVDFTSIEEHKALVNLIAQILHEEDRAGEYIHFYDEAISMVTSSLENLPEGDKIRVYHSINEAVATDGKDTLQADWMNVAGAIDVSTAGNLSYDGDKYYATLEQILAWDPEVIFCNDETAWNYIRTQAAWANIQAVKNGEVYLMPVGVSRWGHTTSIETPLAIVWAAKTLYPDYCADIDLEAMMKDFYKDLYGYEASDDMIAQILAGEGMRIAKDQVE